MNKTKKIFYPLLLLCFFSAKISLALVENTSDATGTQQQYIAHYSPPDSHPHEFQPPPATTGYHARKSANSDFVTCILYSSYCLVASFFVSKSNPTIGHFLKTTALVIPITRFLSSSKAYKSVIEFLPLLGKHVKCSDKACQSICNKCKIKHIYKEAPLFCGLLWATQRVLK